MRRLRLAARHFPVLVMPVVPTGGSGPRPFRTGRNSGHAADSGAGTWDQGIGEHRGRAAASAGMRTRRRSAGCPAAEAAERRAVSRTSARPERAQHSPVFELQVAPRPPTGSASRNHRPSGRVPPPSSVSAPAMVRCVLRSGCSCLPARPAPGCRSPASLGPAPPRPGSHRSGSDALQSPRAG